MDNDQEDRMKVQYIIKRCPYCNATNSISYSWKANVGSPLIECKQCQQIFIDRDRKELYLHQNDFVPQKQNTKMVTLSIFAFLLGVVFLYGSTLTIGITSDKPDTLLLVAGLFTIAGGIFLFVEPIISYKQRMQEWQQEFEESKKRCQNRDYVEFLRKNGL